jgi:hypothetical protein
MRQEKILVATDLVVRGSTAPPGTDRYAEAATP